MSVKRPKVKNCPACGETKPLVYFRTDNGKPDGKKSTCNDCLGKQEDKNLNRRIRRWRWGAKQRNIEWKLTKEYINNMPKICYYTGIALTNKRNLPNTLSLDRIDSNKGYTKNNVVFCCAKINIMKSDMDVDEFIDLCKKISAFQKKKPSK